MRFLRAGGTPIHNLIRTGDSPRFERGNATRANRLRERREPARASERGETRGNPGSRAPQRVCRGSRARRGARGRPYAGGRSREGRAKPLRTPKRKGGRSLSTETDAGRGPRGARVWRGRTGEKRERAASDRPAAPSKHFIATTDDNPATTGKPRNDAIARSLPVSLLRISVHAP